MKIRKYNEKTQLNQYPSVASTMRYELTQ